MNQIAQFDQEAINQAVVEYGPAIVAPVGKTVTDKRLSIVASASEATKLFASNQKGKVGNEARAGLQERGMQMIATAARRGNYKPLAESLALVLAEPVTISSRAAFESLEDRYQPRLDELVMNDKAFKGEKMTSKATALTQCLMLIKATKDGVAAIIAAEQNGADE